MIVENRRKKNQKPRRGDIIHRHYWQKYHCFAVSLILGRVVVTIISPLRGLLEMLVRCLAPALKRGVNDFLCER